jgi:pimeloyl-ACP methyl ester carboxylesterase
MSKDEFTDALAVNSMVCAEGQGHPIVFLHGFPLDHTMWEAQFDSFAGKYRVIAPDLRGFGGSTLPDETPEKAVSTMAEMADDLVEDLEFLEVNEPIVLCGLSMGGYVAFEFWRRHRTRLAGLILCDTRAAPDTPEAAQGRHETAANLLAAGNTEALTEGMIPKLFAPLTIEKQPDIVAKMRERMLATSPAGAAAALRGMAERVDFRPKLGEIALPTLVIVGEQDAISSPAEMRSFAEEIPGATFEVIPRAGHMSPMENPGPVNGEIRKFVSERVWLK